MQSPNLRVPLFQLPYYTCGQNPHSNGTAIEIIINVSLYPSRIHGNITVEIVKIQTREVPPEPLPRVTKFQSKPEYGSPNESPKQGLSL